MSRLVPVGRILRAHGIRGEVVVERFGEGEEVLGTGARVHGHKGSLRMTLEVEGAKPHKQDFIVAFAGVVDRNEAEALKGTTLLVEADRLPPLPEGTYYNFQLEGLTVKTVDGEVLGTLEAVLDTGAHPVLTVRGNRGEVLLPSVEEVVREVDLEKGLMIVELMPGLLPEDTSSGEEKKDGPA
jgi:16S rRNA processing protein RimM